VFAVAALKSMHRRAREDNRGFEEGFKIDPRVRRTRIGLLEEEPRAT
jgi:hypothetical protein